MGSDKYNSYKGKYYKYNSAGEREEISKEDFMKVTKQKEASKKPLEVSMKANGNSAGLSINGKSYTVSVDGMTGKQVEDKFNSIAKHNKGTALKWLKKNAKVEKSS